MSCRRSLPGHPHPVYHHWSACPTPTLAHHSLPTAPALIMGTVLLHFLRRAVLDRNHVLFLPRAFAEAHPRSLPLPLPVNFPGLTQTKIVTLPLAHASIETLQPSHADFALARYRCKLISKADTTVVFWASFHSSNFRCHLLPQMLRKNWIQLVAHKAMSQRKQLQQFQVAQPVALLLPIIQPRASLCFQALSIWFCLWQPVARMLGLEYRWFLIRLPCTPFAIVQQTHDQQQGHR